jgi:hypothetical protein
VSTDELERHLIRDLDQAKHDLSDPELCGQLYRALANNRWRQRDEPDAALALSWTRAERLVNELRGRRGLDRMTLAQTGGEGEIGELASEVLGGLGWVAEPLDTSIQDPAHVGQPAESPPPKGSGEVESHVEDSGSWERQAHREAEDARLGRESAPPATTGEGAGGGRNPSEKP